MPFFGKQVFWFDIFLRDEVQLNCMMNILVLKRHKTPFGIQNFNSALFPYVMIKLHHNSYATNHQTCFRNTKDRISC